MTALLIVLAGLAIGGVALVGGVLWLDWWVERELAKKWEEEP